MSWKIRLEQTVESCLFCQLYREVNSLWRKGKECIYDRTESFIKQDTETTAYIVLPSDIRPCPLKVQPNPNIDVDALNREDDYSFKTGV